eukprot:7383466-Prymnesium_polylepis.2
MAVRRLVPTPETVTLRRAGLLDLVARARRTAVAAGSRSRSRVSRRVGRGPRRLVWRAKGCSRTPTYPHLARAAIHGWSAL